MVCISLVHPASRNGPMLTKGAGWYYSSHKVSSAVDTNSARFRAHYGPIRMVATVASSKYTVAVPGVGPPAMCSV